MRTELLSVLLVVAVCLFVASCKKAPEEQPKGQLVIEQPLVPKDEAKNPDTAPAVPKDEAKEPEKDPAPEQP